MGTTAQNPLAFRAPEPSRPAMKAHCYDEQVSLLGEMTSTCPRRVAIKLAVIRRASCCRPAPLAARSSQP
eukprot:6182002-Pleurochrysis_carterae.AAC.3